MDDDARPPSSWKRWAFAGGCLRLTAIVATIAIRALSPDVVRTLFVATRTRAKMDVSTIGAAVESFAIEHSGRYPTTLMELVTPDARGRTHLGDRRSVPLDPWGNAYFYDPPTATRGFRVFSLGGDGAPGGVGEAADIDHP